MRIEFSADEESMLTNLIAAFTHCPKGAPSSMEEFGAAKRILDQFDSYRDHTGQDFNFPVYLEFSDVETVFLKKVITPPCTNWTLQGVQVVYDLFVKLGWEKDLMDPKDK